MSSFGGDVELWLTESITPYEVYSHAVTRVLVHKRTAFQEMVIVETGDGGKALVLDGQWQSSSADEFLYHEPLVHPACVIRGGPRQVLILGGGEGATLREVLKWRTVERAVMVDIDGEVVEACKRYLPEMHQGAFEDPRAELVIGDALRYVEKSGPQWDVIISDLSDPIDSGPSSRLFTKEYFEQVRRAMVPGGVLAVQAGPVAPGEMSHHVRLVNTLGAVFPHVAPLSSHVPTYAEPWGFAVGSAAPIDVFPRPEAVDGLLAEKTEGRLRMFDGRTMLGLFQVPRYLREAIVTETEIFTLATPARFGGAGRGGSAR